MTPEEVEEIKSRHPRDRHGCLNCDEYVCSRGEWDICDAARLVAEVERLRGVVEAAKKMRGRLIGHEGHFDYTMRRGAGCEVCIGQREVAAEFDAALEAGDGG